MRILIVEQDRVLINALQQSLYGLDAVVVQISASYADIADQEFDLLIMSLDLSSSLGWTALSQLRAQGRNMPVLVLASDDTIEKRVRTLDLGADDYMAKPVSLAELEARLRTLKRRCITAQSGIIHHGPLHYDVDGRVAYLNEQLLRLSGGELCLLDVLLRCSGRVVSRNMLVEHMRELGPDVNEKWRDVYIHRLRRKVEVGAVRITTVRGSGYCLEKIAPFAETKMCSIWEPADHRMTASQGLHMGRRHV